MKDVADLAGVSTSTVSRAFSSPDMVTDLIRLRVFDAARDLNYAINGMARALSRNESGTILIGVPDIGNAFFSQVLKGMERRARALSYSVLISDMSDEPALLEAYAREIAAGRADGIILINGSASSFHLERIHGDCAPRRLKNPLLILMQRDLQTPVATVGVDHEQGAATAMRHLLALGHRKIVHIAGELGNVRTIERVAGFRKTLDEAGVVVPREAVFFGDFAHEIETGRSAVRHFMKAMPDFTAIFASGDEMAMSAVAELKRLGKRVPEDVSVIGFNDLDFTTLCDPPLTTVRQPRLALGEMGMSLMVASLRGEELAQNDVVFEAELVIRESTSRVRCNIE